VIEACAHKHFFYKNEGNNKNRNKKRLKRVQYTCLWIANFSMNMH